MHLQICSRVAFPLRYFGHYFMGWSTCTDYKLCSSALNNTKNHKLTDYRGAPKASGMRSTVYLYPLMNMQGTPGIFRMRPRSSLSQVATMKHRHALTIFTKQSSAYTPLQLHGIRSKRGSLASRKAILYLPPNFSNSPMTQSVTQGMHFANKQSIIARIMSSFFLNPGEKDE
jgi:hypothetical protein